MRNSFIAIVGLVVLCGSTIGAQAQTVGWSTLKSRSGATLAHLETGDRAVPSIEIACDGNRPLIGVKAATAASVRALPMQFRGGSARPIALTTMRLGNGSNFVAHAPPALLDAISGGWNSWQISVGSRQLAPPLDGAGEVLRDALAACYTLTSAAIAANPVQVPGAATSATQASIITGSKNITPNERSAIMRAAGYVLRGRDWLTCDGHAPGEIEEVRDLNGDGRPEAILISFGSACYGNTGQGFQIVTREPAGWRMMVEQVGIALLYPRAGIAWPDIEIGGPGANCRPFLRWNGVNYVAGGTSIGGKICALAPGFSAKPNVAKATAPSKSVSAPASSALTGFAGFTINVSLSSRAAARLARSEGIIAIVSYYGDALPAHRSKEDELGINLGNIQVKAPGRAGALTVPAASLQRERLAWVKPGSAIANVNVVSARLIPTCTDYDPLAHLRRPMVMMRQG